jgi:hypothetical protein
VLDFEVDSARGFVLLWVLSTLGVLAYAGLDLWLHPSLSSETELSMRPDLAQLPDLLHWGGRLLNHGATVLLVGNAVILGGVVALLGRAAARAWAKRRHRAQRVSIVPAEVPTSWRPRSSHHVARSE